MAHLIEVCPVSELQPGESRLVEWEDLEIGVFNCAGTLYAIEDRCSHDDGPLAEGEFDEGACTVECPRHGSLFDLKTGKPQDAARICSGGHLPGDHRRRHDQAGGGVVAIPDLSPTSAAS